MNTKVSTGDELTNSVRKPTKEKNQKPLQLPWARRREDSKSDGPTEDGGRYYIGVTNAIQERAFDKLLSGVIDVPTATRILTALKDIIFR